MLQNMLVKEKHLLQHMCILYYFNQMFMSCITLKKKITFYLPYLVTFLGTALGSKTLFAAI